MSNLPQQLVKVSEFFKPETLQSLPLKYEGDTALLVIDVQKIFCDPVNGTRGTPETAAISRRIRDLAPEFRKAGIPVYAVHVSPEEAKPSEIDFYEFMPHPDDRLIRKTETSAFQGSDIREILIKDKRKKLLACGFNLSACIRETVIDARRAGFEVTLLHDLTCNDNSPRNQSYEERALEDIRDAGVRLASADQVLEQFLTRKKALIRGATPC